MRGINFGVSRKVIFPSCGDGTWCIAHAIRIVYAMLARDWSSNM